MMTDEPVESKKLNDLLCTSFNNVKYDVREINVKLENLKTNFANFSTDSIKTAFEQQTKLLIEQQEALNMLNGRLNQLESKPRFEVTRDIQPIRQIASEAEMKITKAKPSNKDTDSDSIYNIPEGKVRITALCPKSKGHGKKDLNGEWVELTGYNTDLSGFMLHDKGRKNKYKFPQGFKIYGPIKIFSGKGKNTETRIYWNNKRPVWNDDGDIATLRDTKGKVVSQAMAQPTYSFKLVK